MAESGSHAAAAPAPPAAPGRDEIARAVREIVAETLEKPIDAVTPGASLERDLGVDSMGLIEITVSLEERFDAVMPDVSELAGLEVETVDDLVSLAAGVLARGRRQAAER